MILANRLEKQEVEAIDIAQQTTQDYSVVVKNPPPDCASEEVVVALRCTVPGCHVLEASYVVLLCVVLCGVFVVTLCSSITSSSANSEKW